MIKRKNAKNAIEKIKEDNVNVLNLFELLCLPFSEAS